MLLITTLAVSVGLGFCWQENCVASLLCFWVKWETCLFFFFPLCAHTTVCVTVHRLGTCIYRALRIVSSSVLLLSPCNAFLKIYLQYSRHNQEKVEKKRETLITDICKIDFTLTYMFQFKEEDSARSNNSKNVEEKRK